MLNLYDQNGVLKASFEPDNSSTQVTELQSDDKLSISFTMCECVTFDVNDYIDFESSRYWVLEEYIPEQRSTVEWDYSVTLYGVISLVKRYLVLKLASDEYEPIFTYTATAQGHMELIVASLNDGMQTSSWEVGEVVSTDYIIIDYSSTYASDALTNLASEAGTEYWNSGMTLNLCRAEHGDEITLGYNQGIVDMYKDDTTNTSLFTRLIPIGSSRNIVYDDYGYTRLQLPDKSKYVDIDVDKYGVIHHSETDYFAGIYPRRTGTVTSVRSEEHTDDNGDTFKIYYVSDNTLDFDPNDYIMDGLVINMTFNSGDLNSRSFEVNFNSSTLEFEIINQYPYNDESIQLPGSLLPAEGDIYDIWNLGMPPEYYDLAEEEYFEAVEKFIEEERIDTGKYICATDYIYIDENNITLSIGSKVRLLNDKYFSDGYRSSRITKITRNVNNPGSMETEVSEVLSTGLIEQLNITLGSKVNDDDDRLSDSRPASDVSDWAKNYEKPCYTWDEIIDKPNVYTDENANLFSIDWKANNVYAAGAIVMYATGGDTGDGDSDSSGSGGTYYHDKLQNLDLANQHPISAITGLSTALNLKLDSSIIYDWAKASTKPSYSHTEISGLTSQLDLKLDSSEYTASDILAKLKTVDGSGSGLDADLLDGYSSSEFYRIGSTLINTTGKAISELTAIASDSDRWNDPSNVSMVITNSNNALAIGVSGTTNNREALIQVGHQATTYANYTGTLHLNKLGGSVTINDYTAYHAGNTNLSTIDWNCRDLTASGNVSVAGTVVMYAEPSSSLLG